MGKRILLVDDAKTILMTEKMMLAGSEYEVDTAADGAQAIAKVAQKKPDLILLDVVMPNMGGIETCRTLKNDPRTRSIPVVIVTTKGEPRKVEEAFSAGCDDYITKPIDRAELLNKVSSLLR